MDFGSDRLRARFLAPGEGYRGQRFDWTTGLVGLRLDDRWDFLTSEKAGDASYESQGWGLAGEFGIDTPVGHRRCPPGQWFPKIGVGFLRRPDRRPYRFTRTYEARPATFRVRSEPGAVTVEAEAGPDRGWAWQLRRRWSIEASTLTLVTTLTNPGDRPLVTEEYVHNFLGEGIPLTAGWEVAPGRSLDREALAAWVNPEGAMAVVDGRLVGTGPVTKDLFLIDPRPGAARTWTTRWPSGAGVTEEVDFDPRRFHFWGQAAVLSPELYHGLDLAPGASTTWTRRWTFFAPFPPGAPGGILEPGPRAPR